MHTDDASSDRLTRSPDGILGGVCEGLGNHVGISPNILRLGWIIAVLFAGTGLLLYILLWWVLPRADRVPFEPIQWEREQDGNAHPPLRRTAVDRKLLGVCGGIARRWDIDPSIVRLATLTLFTLSGGLVFVAYLIMAIVIPGSKATFRSKPHPVEF